MTDDILGLDAFDTTSAASDGATMEVRRPDTGEVMRWPDGRPWTIKYLGTDSDKVARAIFAQSDKSSQAFMRTRSARPSAMIIKDQIEILVVATVSWDIPLGDGKPAKNDPAEYRTAYNKYKWLYEQGNEFINNRGNFPLKA